MCEIEAHTWSDKSKFDGFEHYNDGEEIRNEYVEWNGERELEWDKDEYPSYEEFCEEWGINSEKVLEDFFKEAGEGFFFYSMEASSGVNFEFDF